jgi:hypothetical protein
VEVKGSGSSLGTRRVDDGLRTAEQGSPECFDEIRGVMADARNSPQSRRVGSDLERALARGRVEYWEVRAPINSQGQSTGIKAHQFDLTPRDER